VTFTPDGSAIEADGSEFVPVQSSAAVKFGTPGHGIWQLGNTPATLYVQYISLVLDADGGLYARNFTTMLVTLDSTSTQFTGTYTTNQTIGTTTTLLSSGTVSGMLIPHVPLP
jgi:hypothetical protein